MGIGVSLILIAVGAILTWAVTDNVANVDLSTVGVILMVVGLAGGLISLMFWSSWGGFGGWRRETTVVHDAPTREGRRTLNVAAGAATRGPGALCSTASFLYGDPGATCRVAAERRGHHAVGGARRAMTRPSFAARSRRCSRPSPRASSSTSRL